MRFDVITLFPELLTPFLSAGVTRRAFEHAVQVKLWQLRDHASDAYRRVDDRSYGGGPGMVMLVEPLLRALQAIRADQQASQATATPVILFSPTGRALTQARVAELAQSPGAVLICGRYEGVDQRFVEACVDEELSLGDYVLSGGEIAAAAVLDAVARLQPGVLNDQLSHQQDSFSDGLLDCPHFSRPEVLGADLAQALGERAVPPVLLSGHHAQIARWRRQQQLELTARRRPDLILSARQRGDLTEADEHFLAALKL